MRLIEKKIKEKEIKKNKIMIITINYKLFLHRTLFYVVMLLNDTHIHTILNVRLNMVNNFKNVRCIMICIIHTVYTYNKLLRAAVCSLSHFYSISFVFIFILFAFLHSIKNVCARLYFKKENNNNNKNNICNVQKK